MFTENFKIMSENVKKSFSTRLNDEDAELLNEVKTLFEEIHGIEFTSDRQLFPYILQAALSRKKPVEVSKKEDLVEIKRLTELVNTLQTENSDLNRIVNGLKTEIEEISAFVNTSETVNVKFEAENSELKTTVNDLQTVNSTLDALVNNLETENTELKNRLQTSKLAENEVLVRLNKFQYDMFSEIVRNKEFAALCRKDNLQGKMSGFSDLVDTADHKTNLANLLTTVVTGAAYQKRMIEIFSREQIQKRFTEFKKQA